MEVFHRLSNCLYIRILLPFSKKLRVIRLEKATTPEAFGQQVQTFLLHFDPCDTTINY